MSTEDLFERAAKADPSAMPLAERLRPRRLEDVVGQDHLLGPDKILRRAIEADRVPSMILWGPPGTGKTTLARLLATAGGAEFVPFSAVLGGVKEIRAIVEAARRRLAERRQRTLLFVDEIHRFNKAQQDALLPHVEQGTVILVGATTENPSFEVNAALLSRCRVFTLKSLSDEALRAVVRRGLETVGLSAEVAAEDLLVAQADGDARRVLTALELAADVAGAAGAATLDARTVAEAASRALRHDRGGDAHYDVVSAFIKSLRGSDPDAAVYWMLRMLEAGEPPRFVLRRMIVFAAEDVGNADPKGLEVALNAARAFEWVGLPEGEIPMAMAATYLASAPKSNAAYLALGAAREDVRSQGTLPVPMHLRNAPTALLKEIGAGAGYRYPHDHPGGFVAETYLPDALADRRYYSPTDRGDEGVIATRLARYRAEVARARDENAPGKDEEEEA
jgi:putative ATPase